MDFTREPIIETIVTPKEGCKIVVRSSKSTGQEEYFVDSLEVISFGNAMFFRSQEKPKAFLVPATDYEVLEVREARMVLKNVGLDRSIKIGGGRDPKPAKEPVHVEKPEPSDHEVSAPATEEAPAEGRNDKKRDRRRQQRRRRGREDAQRDEGASNEASSSVENAAPVEGNEKSEEFKSTDLPSAQPQAAPFSSMLPPPPMLISETIARYKDNALFKNAFYTKEETTTDEEGIEPIKENDENLPVEPVADQPFEMVDEEHKPFTIHPEPSPVINMPFWGDVNEPFLFPPLPKDESESKESVELPEENKE